MTPEPTGPGGLSHAAVLFDSDCSFCRWCAEKLEAWDQKGLLHTVTIQSAEGDRLLQGIPAERRLDSLRISTDDGLLAAGGAALPLLFERLPHGQVPAAAFRRFPGFAERSYHFVADRRDLFAKIASRP